MLAGCFAMTHRILIAAVLVALSVVGCAPAGSSEGTAAEGNLKVEVTPAETTYSISRNGRRTNAFLVRFRVSNLSSNPCLIGVMTCSYWDHWRTDNRVVSVESGACDSNFAILRILTSTNPYTGELPLIVWSTAIGHEITFRMAFSPITNFTVTPPMEGPPPVVGATVIGGTYWSEKIKINVSE